MALKDDQVKELLKPIDPDRVSKDGKGYSHLEIWDVRRTLNRIFGFATWSARTDLMELVSEREIEMKNGKPGWSVIYRARCTLEVGDGFMDGGGTYVEWAAGAAINPVLSEAHDMAIKTAESQAMKRCAVNLGDQFGLSLYRNGSTEATVVEVIGQEHADAGQVADLVAAFAECQTDDDLGIVASEIPGLDLSVADKERLREAYMSARSRLQPS